MLKLQYLGHLMRRVDSLGKTLILGGIRVGGEGDNRGWDGWMASLTQWTWVWVNSGSWCWTGRPGMLRFMGSQRVGHAEWLNWTELIYFFPLVMYSCPLSAGVLHLMVYSWYVHGERCAPCLPTPPPSFIYNSYCHTYFSEFWFLIIYCSYVWPEENDLNSLGVL